jgi:hypothetical protein
VIASIGDAPFVAVKNRYGTPAWSQNSCASRYVAPIYIDSIYVISYCYVSSIGVTP